MVIVFLDFGAGMAWFRIVAICFTTFCVSSPNLYDVCLCVDFLGDGCYGTSTLVTNTVSLMTL